MSQKINHLLQSHIEGVSVYIKLCYKHANTTQTHMDTQVNRYNF